MQTRNSSIKIRKHYYVEKRVSPEIVSSGAIYYVEKSLFFYFPKHLSFFLRSLGERRSNNRNRMTENNRGAR